MPQYVINVDNQKYQIDSENELNQSDFDRLTSKIKAQQTTQSIKDLPKNAASFGYNTLRKIAQGGTYGQASHLQGLGNAVGGWLFNKKNGIENTDGEFYKDYVSGREESKKEMAQFGKDHPYWSFGAEMLGAVGTGGLASKGIGSLLKAGKVLKASKLANNPAVKTAIESGIYGGAYGASNTEGKGFDPVGAAMGATIGVPLGYGFSRLGTGTKNFWDKNGAGIKEEVGKIADIIKNPSKLLLKENIKPNLKYSAQEYAKMADEAMKKGDILAAGDYAQKAKLSSNIGKENKNIKTATVGEVAADENIPYHLLKTVDNWKIKAANGDKRAANLLEKASSEDLPYVNEQYKNDLYNNLSAINEIKDTVSKELYAPFNDLQVEIDNKALNKAIEKLPEEVKAKAEKALNKILNKKETVIPAKEQPEIVNGWQILPKKTADKIAREPVSLKELQRTKQELFDLAQEISYTDNAGQIKWDSSKGGREAAEALNTLRKDLINKYALNIPEQLRNADYIYSSMLDAIGDIAAGVGKKFDKNAVLNKFLGDLRNKGVPEASNMLNAVEENFAKVAEQFKGTPYENQVIQFNNLLQNIKDNASLYQMSYALKPQEAISVVGKRLNTKRVAKTVLDEINNPRRNFRNFVLYAEPNAINKPADKAATDLFKNKIEQSAAKNKLFKKPTKPLYTQQEKEQIKRNLADLYNKRFRNIFNFSKEGGLLPKATIRSLLNKYYDNNGGK